MGVKDEQMAARKGKKTPARATAPRWNDSLFVQYELNDAQLTQLKGMDNDGDTLLDAVLEEVDNGYKFTIKFDTFSEAYACWMLPDSAEHINTGLILSGRGSTPAKALKQLLYKHRVCLDGDWRGHAGRPVARTIDD